MGFESRYELLYKDVLSVLEMMHKDYVRKTSIALKSLLIIPTIFLILLFITNSSKSTFLVLWIVSMFVLAVVLMIIEYQDYKLQKLFSSVKDDEAALKNSKRDQTSAAEFLRNEVDNCRIREIRESIAHAAALAESIEDELSELTEEEAAAADAALGIKDEAPAEAVPEHTEAPAPSAELAAEEHEQKPEEDNKVFIAPGKEPLIMSSEEAAAVMALNADVSAAYWSDVSTED